jgi:hypothetical protein
VEERVSVLTGLSLTVYLLTSFVFWRRGLAEYGMNETLSWVVAVLGTILLVAYAFGAKPLMLHLLEERDVEPGCLVFLALFGGVVLIGYGYWQTIETGGAPRWILNPASILTLPWDDPPGWAKVTSYVISALLALLVAAGGRARSR